MPTNEPPTFYLWPFMTELCPLEKLFEASEEWAIPADERRCDPSDIPDIIPPVLDVLEPLDPLLVSFAQAITMTEADAMYSQQLVQK